LLLSRQPVRITLGLSLNGKQKAAERLIGFKVCNFVAFPIFCITISRHASAFCREIEDILAVLGVFVAGKLMTHFTKRSNCYMLTPTLCVRFADHQPLAYVDRNVRDKEDRRDRLRFTSADRAIEDFPYTNVRRKRAFTGEGLTQLS